MRNFLTRNIKQILISILILISIILYVYGYEISKYLYNSEGLVGKEKKEVINKFWELRFSIYSVIISLLFYVGTKSISTLNKLLLSIGYSLAMFSAIDKLIFKDFDISQYDKPIIFTIILFNTLKYINYDKRKKLHR